MLLRKGRGEEVAENLIFSVTIATSIFLQQSRQSVRVLWYHSYLVWLLFGDSIPICSLI